MPGMIKKEDIEKVRATADLYDIVSATVTLKPSGTGTYVGLCPFHDEKTPSFSVRPALGVWHCFGCGLGGDGERLRVAIDQVASLTDTSALTLYSLLC